MYAISKFLVHDLNKSIVLKSTYNKKFNISDIHNLAYVVLDAQVRISLQLLSNYLLAYLVNNYIYHIILLHFGRIRELSAILGD